MIRYEFITALPRSVVLQLSAHAWEEFRAAHDLAIDPVAHSELSAVIYDDEAPIAALGVLRQALLGPAYVWFLLCHDFRPVQARAMRKLMGDLFDRYPCMETAVEKSLRPLCRFAAFFGFRPVGREFALGGRHYEMYEARKWHSPQS